MRARGESLLEMSGLVSVVEKEREEGSLEWNGTNGVFE